MKLLLETLTVEELVNMIICNCSELLNEDFSAKSSIYYKVDFIIQNLSPRWFANNTKDEISIRILFNNDFKALSERIYTIEYRDESKTTWTYLTSLKFKITTTAIKKSYVVKFSSIEHMTTSTYESIKDRILLDLALERSLYLKTKDFYILKDKLSKESLTEFIELANKVLANVSNRELIDAKDLSKIKNFCSEVKHSATNYQKMIKTKK